MVSLVVLLSYIWYRTDQVILGWLNLHLWCLCLKIVSYFFLPGPAKHGSTHHIIDSPLLTVWKDVSGKGSGRGTRESVDTVYHQERWVRQRMNVWRKPVSSLRTLCKHLPVKGLCRPSASSAGSWSWTLWITATSTPHSRQQSAPGRSRLCGPNWTKGHSTRSTTRIKPAWALG